MKNYLALTGLLVMSLVGAASAVDQTGMLGLNYSVGPSFIVGGSDARRFGSVEPGVGAALQYGILPQVDFVFAYDYLDADLRTQALTFGGQYRFEQFQFCAVTPFAGAGLGFGKPYSGEGWGHFSLKLTGGVIKSLTESVSMAGTLSYQYVQGPDPIGSVHVIEPGVRMIFFFGPASVPSLSSHKR